MEKDLNCKPYHHTFKNEVSHVDMNQCYDACGALLDTFLNTTSHLKVLFTDHRTHDTNVVFWAKEILHFTVEMEHNPPHMMMWACITATHLVGLYFFDGHVNAASYAKTLEAWITRQLRDRGLTENVWLQHNGATCTFHPHCS
jgi:hypothetical protein